MSQSETQRLQAINTQLIELYLRLEDADNEEKQIRSEIQQLEAERDSLPHTTVYSHRAQQYVTILRSTASSVQLHRQSLQQFSGKPNDKLQPDEIRQKNILLNKLRISEKKVATYSEKLEDVGLLPFEIDDIILEGYREQNQRHLQQMLGSLEAAIEPYLHEYFDEHGNLPDNFLDLIESWDNLDNRRLLASSPLRILQLKTECLSKGIPLQDINNAILSVTRWDDAKKRAQLQLLKTKLQQEALQLKSNEDMATKVREWITADIQNQRLTPNQKAIVKLMMDLRIHGVAQEQIEAMFGSHELDDGGFLSSLKNRFRRNS